VGRPFLVRGTERLAAVACSSDWIADRPSPEVNDLPWPTRARLSEHWTRIGLMEHASIAAFARFTLHLLSVGAPPDLVRAAQVAMGDETEHARLAFRLASAYAGRLVGPSALDIAGALEGSSIKELVATLLREGCIGETVAAIEAREALEFAIDPVVREVLAILARDELRHAELAWRTLSWLVAAGRVPADDVREEGLRAVAEASAEPGERAAEPELLAHGIVDDATRQELRRRALAEVFGVCLGGVLEGATPGAAHGLITREPYGPTSACSISRNVGSASRVG
jgi:hypothetical protein